MRAFAFTVLLTISVPVIAAETIKYIYDARGRLIRVERTGARMREWQKGER